jgi:hypothetical protein
MLSKKTDTMRKLLTLQFLLLTVGAFGQSTAVGPFEKYGYKVKMYTSSKGEFEEFHDQTEVVAIGSALFNTRTKQIVGIVEDTSIAHVPAHTPTLSVDPEAARYYWITPYAYVANNPIRLVDPNGREVIITGDAANAATGKLSTNNITVTRDAETGRLSVSGKAGNRDERLLVKAINDDKVTVNLTANKSDVIGKDDKGRNLLTKGGSFMGNTLGRDENGKAVSASANQYVSMDALNRNFDTEDHGAVITHEITEAHQGGLISIRRGEAASPAIQNVPNSIFDQAHNRASYQPLFKSEKQVPLTPLQKAVRDVLNNPLRRY